VSSTLRDLLFCLGRIFHLEYKNKEILLIKCQLIKVKHGHKKPQRLLITTINDGITPVRKESLRNKLLKAFKPLCLQLSTL
jgi:hypothetical protein